MSFRDLPLLYFKFITKCDKCYYSSIRGGFGAGTTSCKRHEMSSKKCVGRGGLGLGYLPEEGEVRVRANKSLL